MAIISGQSWRSGDTIALYDLLMLDTSNPATELMQTDADTAVPIAVATSAATDGSELSYELIEPGKVITVHSTAGIRAGYKVSPGAAGICEESANGDHVFGVALEAISAGTTGKVVCITGYFWAVDN